MVCMKYRIPKCIMANLRPSFCPVLTAMVIALALGIPGMSASSSSLQVTRHNMQIEWLEVISWCIEIAGAIHLLYPPKHNLHKTQSIKIHSGRCQIKLLSMTHRYAHCTCSGYTRDISLLVLS